MTEHHWDPLRTEAILAAFDQLHRSARETNLEKKTIVVGLDEWIRLCALLGIIR